MRNLRVARTVWAWLSGLVEDPGLDPWDELIAVCYWIVVRFRCGGRERRGGGVRREPCHPTAAGDRVAAWWEFVACPNRRA